MTAQPFPLKPIPLKEAFPFLYDKTIREFKERSRVGDARQLLVF